MILFLFDIDGTLLAAHGSGRAAFDAVMKAQHDVDDASRGIHYGGKTDHALIDEICVARIGRVATAAEHDAFIAAYLAQLAAQLAAGGAVALDGVHDVLAELRARDRAIVGIATGNVRAGAEQKLAAAAIDPAWFAVGGYGCDAADRAALVGAAIRRGRERAPIDEVIVIGDTVYDIAAARANGATVCAVATGGTPASGLGAADVVFESLRELPGWLENRAR